MRTMELNHFLSRTRSLERHTSTHNNHIPHTGHPWWTHLSVSLNQSMNYSAVRQSEPPCKKCLHQACSLINNRPQTLSCLLTAQRALKWVLSSWGEASGVKVSLADPHKKQKTCRATRFTWIVKSTQANFSAPQNLVAERLPLLTGGHCYKRITSGQKEHFNSSGAEKLWTQYHGYNIMQSNK